MSSEKYYDVIVAGGGIAGVAAALAAARRGAKTALIEKTVYTGGLATTGLIYIYLPLCDGNGTQVSFGLTEKLLKASVKYGPGDIPEKWRNETDAPENKRYRTIFNPASFILAMDEMLEEAGVDVWFDTVVCKTIVEDGTAKGIEVENKSGRVTLNAGCLIDATGDADLAWSAGLNCPTRDNAMAFWALEYNKLSKGSEAHPDLAKCIPMHLGGDFMDKIDNQLNGIDGKKVSDFVVKGRRGYRERLNKMYASGELDRNSLFPLFLPAMAQFRMTRRIDGEFTLNDGMEWTWFEDSIGMVGDWRKSGYVWELPYRSLLPKGIKNLLAVGRCMSSEGDAWQVTRVIPTAGLTGEVAGVAAAMSLENRTTPDALDYKALQRELAGKYGFPLHFEDVGLKAKKMSYDFKQPK